MSLEPGPCESKKIAVAVHGRFHAFDLARELLQRGHQVTLFTNYPKQVVSRFGLPPDRVRSLLAHGVASRALHALQQKGVPGYPEAWLHTWFGRWAASQIGRQRWDVVVCWSGVGEETFRLLEGKGTLRVCQRGSSHIRAQARLLAEERARTGGVLEQPSAWIMAREEREYALADMVQVPSTFARQTFLAEGVPASKVDVLLLGVDTHQFRPSGQVVEDRIQRILSGQPLRVINAGAFSLRKGMWDLAVVVRQLAGAGFDFRFVGPVAAEAGALAAELEQVATFVPKQPQAELPGHYAWADLFVLPTIEDGYQMVLAQAAAAGLPILTTEHGAGRDLVQEGKTGWVLPVRDPDGLVERLKWCYAHRRELAAMARLAYDEFRPRDWADVARDFERCSL